MLLGTYRGNVYPKTGFWVHVGMAGADGFEPPNDGIRIRCLTTWRSPYRKRPFTGPLYKCVLSAEGLYQILAGVDGIKPPRADLESAVLLTELNSYGGTNGYRTHDLLRDRQAF